MERGGAGGWRGSPNRGWRNLRTGQRRPMGRQDGAGAGPGAVKPRLLGSAGLGRSQVRVRWSRACGRRRGRGAAPSGERRPAGGTGHQLREQVYTAFSLHSRICSKGKHRHTLSEFREINSPLRNQLVEIKFLHFLSTPAAENKKLSVMLVWFCFGLGVQSHCLLFFYKKTQKNWILLCKMLVYSSILI